MSITSNKEAQRAELHKAIWGIADEVRGAVDGWDFKAYILCFLFYRFISEDLTEYIDAGEREAGNPDFSYANLTDEEAEGAREGVTEEKGYFILPSQLFQNVAKAPEGDSELNIHVSEIFKAIEGSSVGMPSEKDFKGLFDDVDVTSNKLGATLKERIERLAKIISGIRDLDFGNVRDASIDLFGDAYEYLMNMYASGAGKSGGEFFTPQEVSELLARIVIGDKTSVNKVYDPACGSGSLLLKFAKILGTDSVHQGFFGQEINPTTYNLCRINMFLHDVNYDHFNIAYGDTLINPQHWDDEPFEVIVSNPPYIPDGDIAGLDASVRDYEPHLALKGGVDGLDFYRAICAHWREALRPGGRLYFEVGIGQADDVLRLMRSVGFGDLEILPDPAGIPRVVLGALYQEI